MDNVDPDLVNLLDTQADQSDVSNVHLRSTQEDTRMLEPVDLWTTWRGQVTPGNWTGPQGRGAGPYGPLHDGHGAAGGLGESRIGREPRRQIDRIQQAPVVDYRL